jgi:predicted Zn-dependent peptidase
VETIKLKARIGVLSGSEKTASLSTQLAIHRALNLPSTQERLQEIDRITPEQIQAAALKYFKKPSLTAIMATEKDLEAHGLPKSSL